MFQEFPYSDMHQLNLDWIIKIAKDFLDQYTHIQELIANGEESLQNLTEEDLQQLQNKADALEALLQEWYNTHSEDIATQLASALSDLNNWYTTHENYLDQTLADNIAEFNQEANAKLAETLADIPVDYTALAQNVTSIQQKLNRVSPNLFNKNSFGIQTTRYILDSSWQSNGGNTHLGATHPIFCKQGTTYKFRSYHDLYGAALARRVFKISDPSTMTIESYTSGTPSADNYYVEWQCPADGYYVVDFDPTHSNKYMFCDIAVYPSGYVPFNIANMADGYPNVFLTYDNDGSAGYKVLANMSPNLFNKNSTSINYIRWADDNGWEPSGQNAQLGSTHPIHCEAGKTYKWRGFKDVYGAITARTAFYLTGDNVTGLYRGTWEDSTQTYVTWTCELDGNYIFDIDMYQVNTFMFCEEDKYPSAYMEYNVLYVNNSLDFSFVNTTHDYPLAGKTIVFCGDSIFEASTDRPDYLNGWFGRLAQAEHNIGSNNSLGGSTITKNAGTNPNRRYICSYIDTLYTIYPNLDYLILEGGTNDADLLGDSTVTPSARFGTWTPNDFSGSYDDETFCGAVETLFYKAINYYPHAKIGFIIAMEMGTGVSTEVENRKFYFDEIVKIANKWHIPVLNLWNNSGADARLLAFYDPSKTQTENVNLGKFYIDGQHPTSYGYEKTSRMVNEWIKSL